MKVCLAMVVKNEAKLIREALNSVKPFIDRWVVVDTGSTDGTQDIVRQELADVPGVLYERPWVNWAHNRTEALTLAAETKTDFIFILDADETVSGELPELDRDSAYWVTIKYSTIDYKRPNILSTKFAWKYVGVTHEYLTAEPSSPVEVVIPMTLTTHPTRTTKSRERCLEDAVLLEKAMVVEPNNTRYAFYLAQSYRDAGEWGKALDTYETRAAMGGWYEEVWYSYLQVAILKSYLSYPDNDVTEAFVRAHNYNPTRPETLGMLTRYLRMKGFFQTAYHFAKRARTAVLSREKLFVDNSYATWRNLDEYAILAYWTGRYRESIRACDELLSSGLLPAEEIDRVKQNKLYSVSKVGNE